MSALPTSVTSKSKKSSFHATNVWNDLVAGFRSRIELRKYRRNYFTPTYEQCFSSLDAINCMVNVLKLHPNFETKQIEKCVASSTIVRWCRSIVLYVDSMPFVCWRSSTNQKSSPMWSRRSEERRSCVKMESISRFVFGIGEKRCVRLFRLLSKSDENIFQSTVTTSKTTDQPVHTAQEASASALSDVNRLA